MTPNRWLAAWKAAALVLKFQTIVPRSGFGMWFGNSMPLLLLTSLLSRTSIIAPYFFGNSFIFLQTYCPIKSPLLFYKLKICGGNKMTSSQHWEMQRAFSEISRKLNTGKEKREEIKLNKPGNRAAGIVDKRHESETFTGPYWWRQRRIN